MDVYPPLRDLAAIGDKRTVALVARDGTVEWMCVPRFDGDPVFASLLDRRRGGRLPLPPTRGLQGARRYRPGTNGPETTVRPPDRAGRGTHLPTLSPAAPPPATR